jgi:thiamine phosphate synthase YjbQ (UPF0047 family)
MRIETTRLSIVTDDGVSIEDITAEVDAFVQATGIESGLCVMTMGQDGCFLSLAPDLDEAFDDLLRLVREQLSAPAVPRPDEPADRESAPDRSGSTPAFNASPGVLADCLSFAVGGGAIQMGNWDAIVFIDSAGPQVRAVEVTLMGAARV